MKLPTFRRITRDRFLYSKDERISGQIRIVTPRYKRIRDVPDFWVSQPLGDAWIAAFRIVTSGGHKRVAECRVFPAEPDYQNDGEWSGCWKGFHADAPKRGLTKEVLRLAQPHSWLSIVEKVWPSPRPKIKASKEPTRGRPSHSDLFLAQIAREYSTALEAGKKPVKAIVSRHRGTVEKIRTWIHQARLRGFLTQGAQGRTVGSLTAKARFVLESEGKR
jgi:hypothetical protein